MSEQLTGTHLGSWWIPGFKSNKCPGLLSIDETGLAILELSGSPEKNKNWKAGPLQEYPVIFGVDNHGTKYSVFGCIPSNWSGHTFEPYSAVTLRCTRVVVELHVRSANDNKFLEIALRSPRLTNWWIPAGVDDLKQDKDTVTQVQRTPAPVSLGIWSDTSVELTCQLHTSCTYGGPRPVDVTKDVYLRLSGPSGHSLEHYAHLLEMVCTFAAVALQKSIDTPQITALSDANAIELEPGRYYHPDIPVLWPVKGCAMQDDGCRLARLLSIESQGDLVTKMLTKWYDNYEQLEPIADVLLNPFYRPHLSWHERFDKSVSALEGLHRIVHKSRTHWTEDKWNQRLDSVINTSARKKVQKWARDLLRNGNEPSLQERLTQFCDDSAAFFNIDKDRRNEFATEASTLRNGFFHFLPKSAKAQSDYRRIAICTRKTEALLLVSMYKYLGWTDADAVSVPDADTHEWERIRNAFRP